MGTLTVTMDPAAQRIVLAILRSPGILAAQLDAREFAQLVALVQEYR